MFLSGFPVTVGLVFVGPAARWLAAYHLSVEDSVEGRRRLTTVNLLNVLIAVLAGFLIIRLGLAMLRGLARPVPEPPPAGELRKVKIIYRCSICGTEVRMTVAPDTDPEPPRHCLEDMDLVTPVD